MPLCSVRHQLEPEAGRKPCETVNQLLEPVSATCYRLCMTQPFDGDPAGFIGKHDEETIELEFSAEQMLALTQAVAASQSPPGLAPSTLAPSTPAPISFRAEPSPKERPAGVPPGGASPKAQWRRPGVAALLGISAALASVGGVTYWAKARPPPVHLAADIRPVSTPPEAPAPVQSLADATPVRFTNPFDRAEVFEFPAGTRDTEARDAVAALLLDRARERQGSSAQVARKNEKSTDRSKHAAAPKLAQRD